MAVGVTAVEVANILTFVAPGYFARVSYQNRFPQRPATGDLAELVAAVALSLPLVAAADLFTRWLGWSRDPLALRYVVLLLGTAIVAGYLAAVIRDTAWFREVLGWFGLRHAPESSVLELVMRSLKRADAQLTITLRDGDVVAGTPRHWSGDPEVKLREIYLTNVRWYDGEKHEWDEPQTSGGVLVNVGDIASIQVDPGGPQDEAADSPPG
jgi:uncharacterized protein DUF6338